MMEIRIDVVEDTKRFAARTLTFSKSLRGANSLAGMSRRELARSFVNAHS